MVRRSVLVVALVIVAAAASLAGYKYWRVTQRANADAALARVNAPPTVATAIVHASAWRGQLRATGSVVAVQQVRLSAPLAGVVQEIRFGSGSAVKAGQVLVQLDNIEDKARLDAAIADSDLAQLKLRRERDLLGRGLISRAQTEETEALATRAAAEVTTSRAVYDKKFLRAPFSGYAAIRDVNLGQYLAQGDPVVDIQTRDPVYVDFNVSQDNLVDLKAGASIAIRVGATQTERSGRISSINPGVDSATHTVRARATVANADGALRPGMFVQVAVPAGADQTVVAVPVTAVRRTSFATSIFVVVPGLDTAGKRALTVKERIVTLGPASGDRLIVTSGLQEGDVVVVAGAFKLQDGATVLVDNSALPPGVSPPAP